MRDPKRIQAFCDRLARAWERVPDWRFGQLMSNFQWWMGRDVFYIEDDQTIAYIEDYTKKNSPYHKPPEE